MRVTVFCGARDGVLAEHRNTASRFGRLLTERGLGLVYGGGSIGLMGALADGALAGGGEVIGVIPEALATAEVAHHGVSEMHVVTTLAERKTRMMELGDAFVALPGGLGTLDELFEVLTWVQLDMAPAAGKRIGALDVEGHYGTLKTLIDGLVESGFVGREDGKLLYVDRDPERLLDVVCARSA